MTLVFLPKHWIIALLCLVVAVMPLAAADTIPLISNKVGISRSVDSLIPTQAGPNKVRVNARLNSGNTFKLQRGRLGFDVESPLQLRPRHNSWRRHNLCGPSTDLAFQHLKATQSATIGGSFSFDLASPSGGPKGITSADHAFVHHFCAGGGTNCVPSTRFAAGAPKPTTVPESGTLTLLGTALLVTAGMVRRRFQWAVSSRRDIKPGSQLLATRNRALPFASFRPIAREIELRVRRGN
jgi:hypothetical protein